MEEKIKTKFFICQIIEFELGVANSRNIEQDTCHRQSMCQQTPLRFYLKLGETFSKSFFLRLMKKHDKSTQMGHFHMLNMKLSLTKTNWSN